MHWSIIIALAVVSLWLIARGCRGRRIDEHPLCRRCGYDLHGISQPEHCPECGRDLAASKRAIRMGHRRARRGHVALGAIAFAAALGFGGMTAWTQLSGFDWQPHKPLWLLKREAEGKNAGKAQAAVTEMISRAATGKLSRGQLDALVNRALAAQVDRNLKWFDYPADVLEAAWETGRVSNSIATQYAQQALQGAVMLQARPRAQRGKDAYVAIRHQVSRAGAAPWALRIEYDFTRVMLDGVPLSDSDRGLALFDVVGGAGGTRVGRIAIDAEPGLHLLAVEGTCRLFANPYGKAGNTPFVSMSYAGGAIAQWALRIEKAIEVMEGEVPAVAAVSDAALGEGIKGCVKVDHLRIVRDTQPGMMQGSSTSQIAIDRPPMDVSFDMFLRAGGKGGTEWWIGTLVQARGVPRAPLIAGTRPMYAAHPDLPDDVTELELVLRGNPTHAERGPEIAEYWSGEIVIGTFPVETETNASLGVPVFMGPDGRISRGVVRP